ncbi:rhodanese-related sulfurtransferase [Klebsiella pneumoniae subsp. pneumoniae]|nr:rhodanese-related sulfurtransferase [Klebsiella pneumoniae subsp. pneumoniae]
MLAETEPRTTISFYKYFTIVDPQATRDALWVALTQLKVFGRIYLAREGINAQISVPQSNVEALREFLYGFDPALAGLRFNIAVEDDGKSFWVLRLKVRDRIVADGIDDPSFDASNVGSISRRRKSTRCLTIRMPCLSICATTMNMRWAISENALEIPADTFRDQLPKAVEMMQDHKDKKIVMYCTGGIRCEKASAWMKHNGFNKVWHIEGGIIEYARRAREQGLPVRFIGKKLCL